MSRRIGLSQPGVRAAFGAALLFGASTPLAKLLLQSVNPWVFSPPGFVDRIIVSTQGFWPLNAWHETFGCQFTNAPLRFSFHAQTWSV